MRTQDASGSAIQVLGQEAKTGQGSFAGSLAAQFGASNHASPVRVKSPGGGGSVSQQNTAGSSATSGNTAGTTQSGAQDAAHEVRLWAPIQVLGQKADTEQLSKALSAAFQFAPSNDSSPRRVWSGGGGGSVAQGNTSSSLGNSGNSASDGRGGDASELTQRTPGGPPPWPSRDIFPALDPFPRRCNLRSHKGASTRGVEWEGSGTCSCGAPHRWRPRRCWSSLRLVPGVPRPSRPTRRPARAGSGRILLPPRGRSPSLHCFHAGRSCASARRRCAS